MIKFKLSTEQMRLWVESERSPKSTLLHTHILYSLKGNLDVLWFKTCLKTLLQQEAIFNSYFKITAGIPQLCIRKYEQHALKFIDLSRQPSILDVADEVRYIEKEANQPIDLLVQPNYRISLYRSKHKAGYYFSCVLPHILIDAYSCELLFNRLASLYNKTAQGQVHTAINPIGQDTNIIDDTLKSSSHYWENQLKQHVLSLDFSCMIAKEGSNHQGSYVCEYRHLSSSILKEVNTLAKKIKTTPFLIFMALYALILHRYTGQMNFSIVYPVSNRKAKQKKALGHYVNLLPSQFRFQKNLSLLDLIKAITQQRKSDKAHASYPYTFIHRFARMHHQDTFNLLFSKTLFFPNFTLNGLKIKHVPLKKGHVGYGLGLLFDTNEQGALFCLEYDADRFPSWFTQQLLNHFIQAIHHLKNNIDQCIVATYPLLNEAELQTIINYAKPHHTQKVNMTPLSDRLNQIMDEFPERIAVRCNDSKVTYQELKQQVNQLASYLASVGVTQQDRVALLLERQTDYIVAILALVKLGCTYVPIDKTHPEHRIRYMLSDASVQYALCKDSHQALYSQLNIKMLSIKAALRETKQPCLKNVDLPNDALMYVIYTSGTTGCPKGVPIKYEAIDHLFAASEAYFTFTHHDVWSLTHSFAFDFSVWELWGALLHGATVSLVSDNTRQDPIKFYHHIAKNKITICNITPSAFKNFIAIDKQEKQFLSLRYVIFGGEKLVFSDITPWLAQHGDTQPELINMYGLTEVPIHATYHKIHQNDGTIGSSLIGKPLPSLEMSIVDAYGNRLPRGVYGEIELYSPYITKGYLKLKEVNQEKFLNNPLKPNQGKIYKTGDYACWLQTAEMNFLGRIDQQVQLNGYRIELEEINQVLRQHALVEAAISMLHKDKNAQKSIVTFCIGQSDKIEKSHLYALAKEKLPFYMIPASILFIEKIPLTIQGKVDLQYLKRVIENQSVVSILAQTQLEPDLILAVTMAWQDVLGTQDVTLDKNYFDQGGDSISLLRLHYQLEQLIDKKMPLQDLFSYTTIYSQAEYLAQLKKKDVDQTDESTHCHQAPRTLVSVLGKEPIAIIGLSINVPGASTVDQFLENILKGKDSIHFFPKEELESSIPQFKRASYVRAKGYLDKADYFDADFFDYNAHESSLLDPQHRLLLEYSWSALESAGYFSEKHAGKIGIFVGQSNVSSYYNNHLFQRTQDMDLSKQYQILLNNSPDFLANRLAYKLNLTGPAMTVQTGCSTSLVAVCRAVHSLRSNECAMAIAGGVCLTFPLKSGYEYQPGMILSQDGHCRPFDKAANGTVPGNGIGIVILKRYTEALAAGDPVYAIIKGCAVNNDGHRKIGFTAPSEQGQTEVIKTALRESNVAPDTIDYIEAHGTGTALGDPIEINALAKAVFSCKKNKACVIGSVKSNIGHLDAAAGVVGLIKTALCLHQKVLAPTVHFKSLNSRISMSKGHFNILTQSKPWEKGIHPRRAGVSSFGIGGTNAHIILEEAEPSPSIPNETSEVYLSILSAKTPKALSESCRQLADYLDHKAHAVSLSNIAYTLQLGRQHFPYRTYQLSQSRKELIEQLRAITINQHPANNTVPTCYFMFPGQGAERIKHIDSLYPMLPVFKEMIIRCTEYLHQHYHINLQALFSLKHTKKSYPVNYDDFNQLYLFIVDYSLAKQLIAWGIHPSGMIGHNLGEYVSACLAGIWSLEDTLSILLKRQNLMNQLPEGQLLAVSCGLNDIETYLRPPVVVAAVNSPKRCTLSGSVEAIELLKNNLIKRGIACRFIPGRKAYHSQVIDSIQEEFESYIMQFTCHAPQISVISNVTGRWLTQEEAVSPGYWGRQMRQTVLFSLGIETLIQNNNNPMLIELGFGNHLSTFVHQHQQGVKTYPLLGQNHSHSSLYKTCLETLGQLWQSGCFIDWSAFNKPQVGSRVSLPTYPFQRKCYRFEGDKAGSLEQGEVTRLYQPNWILAPQSQSEPIGNTQDTYLLFNPVTSWSQDIHEQLCSNSSVLEVKYGNKFKRLNSLIELRCHHQDDFVELFSQFKEESKLHIIYFWPTCPNFCFSSKAHSEQLSSCYRTLKAYLYLLKAVSALHLQSIKLTVFTQGLCFVKPCDPVNPLKSVLLGPGRTIRNEIPGVSHKIIDLPSSENLRSYISLVTEELKVDQEQPLVAYRDMKRFVQKFVQVSFPDCSFPFIKAGGVYVITGGLGHIGLIFAEYLSSVKDVRIVLISRRGLSTHKKVDNNLKSKGSASDRDRFNRVKARVHKLAVFQCDITQYDRLDETFQKIRERYGKITGVIHAAGINEGGSLTEIDLNAIESSLCVKIDGVCNLHAVTCHDHLDFMLLCSALSTLAGDYGQSIYNSANAFLDAFAHWRSFHHAHTISVNWDTWTEGGMAKSWMDHFHVDYDGIRDQEALSLIPELLSYQGAQLVVTKQKLSKRIEDNFLENLAHQKSASSMSFPLKRPKSSLSIRLFIEQLWRQHLDYQPTTTSEHFHELGGDSLLAVQLASLLSNTYGINIHPHTFIEYPTIKELCHYIKNQIEPYDLKNKKRSNLHFCLISLTRPSKNKFNVFLIHPIGGTVHIYSELARYLGKVANVYGVQAKALDGYSDLSLTITEMAAYYINCLKTVQAKGDYFIGGASLGGLLGYEMSQQLSQQGDTVRLLFLMDTPSPEHYPKKISTCSEVMKYMLEVGAQHDPPSEFDTYSLEDQLNYFLKHAGRLRGALQHFDHDHLKYYLTIYQHNMKAMLSHQLKPPIIPYPSVYYYRASIRTSLNPLHPETGWEALFKGNLEVRNIPGNHITMLLYPFVSSIGEHLAQSLQNSIKQSIGEVL